MDAFIKTMFEGFTSIDYKNVIMYILGISLIYLAIKKDYEPMLLLPIGFGAILANLPFSAVIGSESEPGILKIFFDTGILTEIFPILIFIAIGAMIDFTPLFQRPAMIFLGAAAQLGIFLTIIAAVLIGFDLRTAAAIGIIGSADGPTSIFVASKLAHQYIGPISVAAYTYMSLVPIIQPPIIRMLTTRRERLIKMDYTDKQISKTVKIIFPIAVTFITGVLVPTSVPLVGMLMFGNLIRESGVLERLSKSAQNELANLVTLLLGITIGATMSAEGFLQPSTLLIILIGAAAFVFDTAGGVLFAKLMNLFLKSKINPMIGAAGLSAFPMSARVVQKMAQKEDPGNFILMPAVSANVSGQLGSAIAGGILLSLIYLFT